MGVTVATIRVAANTSEGTQDFATTDLGGLTPKAVLLIATRATADGTAADGAGWYIGASDGTNEWAGSYEDEHAQATTDGKSDQDTTANRILTIYDGTADGVVAATADFDSFITNGVRINWTDAPPAAYLVTAIFFAGSDLTAAVGASDLGNTADAAIDITTVGFEADDVICAWLLTTSSADGFMGLGFIHNDRAGTVTQRAAALASRGFGTSQLSAVVRSDACIVKIIQTGSLDYYGTAQDFDSSGFTVQLANARSPANADLGWIALRYGASPVISSKVYTYSTPTSTGSNTDAGAGLEPQAVMYIPTYCVTASTIETDADAGTIGLSVIDVAKAYSNSVQAEDAQADSDTQSMSDDKAINLPTDAGGTGIEAAFTSFGATGVTLNFTAVAGAAKLFPAIAWGINAGGGTSYNFAATISMVTTTPAATLAIARPMAAASAWQAATPDAALTVARALASAIDWQTLTPDAALVIARALAAVSSWQTATPNAALIVARSLSAASDWQTATPDAGLAILRTLAAVSVWQTATGDAALNILRALAATSDWQTVSPDAGLTVTRPMSALSAWQTLTPDASLSTGGVLLAASIGWQTATPDATLNALRALVASIDGQTVTPAAALVIARILTAASDWQTATPSAALTVARPMAATSAWQTLTPDATLASLVSLASVISWQAATPTAGLVVARALQATSAWQTATGQAVMVMIIRFSAVSAWQTVTPAASLDTGVLAVGLVRVTFTAKRPGASFTAKRPSVTFTEE